MITPRVERRLAAILAADIVGYSRLVEQDEAATLAALRELRSRVVDPLLAEHQGRIVKLMGDGAIVEFGSVVDAVACAVAIQRASDAAQAGAQPDRRLVFRIGINLGDVVVDGDDLLGDGVNVAARLEQLAEPGGVLVSGTAYDHLQGRLGLPLDFAGAQRVKNIARLVRTYRVRLDGRAVGRTLPWRKLRLAAAAALVLSGAIGMGWWSLRPGGPSAPALPDVPSVAVLPFANPTGDARLGRLADGMVGDLIAELGRFGLFVIARSSSFQYRGREHDTRDIGRELGVGFVVEGSLEGDGTRLRATVGLIDATNGRQLWSARYDRPLADLFAVQDEMAQRIANSLGGSEGAINRARLAQARAKPENTLQAYDLYLLAGEARDDGSEAGNQKAQDLVQRAIALDPTFTRAYVLLAATYRRQVQRDWAPWEEAMAGWLAAATRAVKLDPDDGWARMVLSDRYVYDNDLAQSASELRRAADLADGDAELMIEAGHGLVWIGQVERGVDLVERGVRLDPGQLDHHRWALRNAYFFARRFEAAAEAAEASDDQLHGRSFWNALIYAQLGRAAEADLARKALLAEAPGWSAERSFSNEGDFLLPDGAAQRALYLESIAKAGLPICAAVEELAQEPDLRRMPDCDAERAKPALVDK